MPDTEGSDRPTRGARKRRPPDEGKGMAKVTKTGEGMAKVRGDFRGAWMGSDSERVPRFVPCFGLVA